jgi:O-succinylbenzoate synthase
VSPRRASSSRPERPEPGELLDGLHVVALPMRLPFRGVRVREAALVLGPSGWAEFAPFVEYDPPEAARWLAATAEAGWGSWPAAVRSSVPVNATVPAVAPADVEEVLTRFGQCPAVKVKVAGLGSSVEGDLARVAAVRAAVGPRVGLRVDANGGWDVETALDALGRLARYDLEYAEQPVPTLRDLRALRVGLARRGTDVLLAADESIRKADDPRRVAAAGAADVVVLKAAPLGGVAAALEVASACGLPCVVSSALDTSVGLAAGVALAAALPELPYACGLGTAGLLAADVADPALLPRSGAVPVGRVAADEDLLRRWAAPPDRLAWWRERVRACAALL